MSSKRADGEAAVRQQRNAPALQGALRLGFPVYFAVLLGVWKILGAIAILLPRFPLLKEWAYAGIFFDLTGAAVGGWPTLDQPIMCGCPILRFFQAKGGLP